MPVNETPVVETACIRCYAIRRVNPFLGVLQVIETSGGRAISANGVVWDIEVLAERSGGWGSLNQNSKQVAYYRYGLWSLEDGLVNRPLAPHLESDPLTQQSQDLIDCIRGRLGQLPFPLQDHRELWLFDKEDQRPVALLASATADSKLPSPVPKYWVSCIGANGVTSQHRFPEARELEEQVKQIAGFNVHKHWITRQADGRGIVDVTNIQMNIELFPPFLLTEDWPDAEQVRRASDYLEWIAPSLLTLQQLSNTERERMEKCLHIQAVSVEHHWHLYPEILDEKYLTAAKVQCRIQHSNQIRREAR